MHGPACIFWANLTTFALPQGVGHSLLVEDMRVACWEGQHAEYAAVAAVCVLVYPLGVPLFLAVKLWRNRDVIKTVRARPGRLSALSAP